MNTRLLILAAGLALSASVVNAQTQTKPASPTTQPPMLSGPKVTEGSGVPGEQRQFAPGRVKGKEQMGAEIPHRLFMRAVEALRADDTPEDVRLTADQNTQVRAVNEQFMKSVTEYKDAHRAEVPPLLAKLSPEDRRKAQEFLKRNNAEGRPPALDTRKNASKKALAASPDAKPDASTDAKPEEMMDAGDAAKTAADSKVAEDARAKLKEIFEGAPSPADTHSKIYALLNDAQKKAFEAELAKAKSENGRGLQKAEKKVDSKLAKKDAKTGNPEAISPDDPRIPERLRERFKNMTPEQREEAVQRFREHRKGGTDGEPKPAPSTTDVPLPEPK